MSGSGADDESVISTINVTPLVDVVLVLLVVLMVAGGYLAREALPLDLPEGRASPAPAIDALEVSIDAMGVVSVGGRVVDAAGLRMAAQAHAGAAGPDACATLAADPAARHADVVSVLDVLRQEHVEHTALRVDPSTP